MSLINTEVKPFCSDRLPQWQIRSCDSGRSERQMVNCILLPPADFTFLLPN